MRTAHWLVTSMLGLLLTGCVGVSTGPTPEVRQALAPTGKLRVGLQSGNPLNVTRDSASGEMKGWDLTSEKSWPGA
jgi:polar amino acid transport system substrate-binding protein